MLVDIGGPKLYAIGIYRAGKGIAEASFLNRWAWDCPNVSTSFIFARTGEKKEEKKRALVMMR
jgi:hypothetical protein